MELTATPARWDRRAWLKAFHRWGVEGAIVLLALVLRTVWLGVKPPHFDEGVNGWFVDQMTANGCYHYDPTNFHGPFHFYLLFLAQTLLGRHIWALRLPVVLFSTAAVALNCAFRRFWHPHTCRLAALALAVSPAMTFYARYAIHESELLFFLLLMLWGLLGMARDGDYRSLMALAAGAAGCILTKETYAIHFVAFALAWPSLLLMERLLGWDSPPRAVQRWTDREGFILLAICLGAIVFFYSGALQSWEDLGGLGTTFRTWIATGTSTDTTDAESAWPLFHRLVAKVHHWAEGKNPPASAGQDKPWHYWFELMGKTEWTMALGFLAALWFAFARSTDRAMRFTLIYGLGAFTAYALVPYKTPWCLVSIGWPFLFLFADAIRRLSFWLDRWTIGAIAALVLGQSLWAAALLNFRNYTDEEEPYVYVQTLPEIDRIFKPLRRLVARDPAGRYLSGYQLLAPGDGHPLPWLLAEYPGIVSIGESDLNDVMDADILIVADQYASTMKARLTQPYFYETLVVRGQAGGEATHLYLRADTFQSLFPRRAPEFAPPAIPPSLLKDPSADTPPPASQPEAP